MSGMGLLLLLLLLPLRRGKGSGVVIRKVLRKRGVEVGGEGG